MSPIRSLLARARWLIDPGESLGRKAANAGAWAFLLNMTNRLLTVIRAGVLANLLAPSDFGLMGIAMLVIGLVTSFTQTGFKSALVQSRRGLEGSYLDTAWTVEISRGILLGALMALGAPLVGSFFDTPAAVDLTRVLGAGLAIAGFVNTGVISFDKDLDFQRRFFFRAAPNVVDLIVSVVLALMLGNAWALAWGWMAGRAAQVVASFIAHPYRPHLRFDRSAGKAMFGFGIWTLASQILIYLTLNVDDIVVGRVVDAAALGLYQMAFTMSQLTTTEITSVVNQVAFPAYSRLQDELPRLGRAYTRTLQLVALAAFPVATGLWFVGEQAVETLLGSKWLPMVPAFNILLVWGLIRSVLATTGPLFRGIGKPGVATKIQAAHLAVLAAIIYPLTARYGIEGAAWATIVAAVIPDAVAMVLVVRTSQAQPADVAKALGFPAVSSVIMVLALTALARFTPLPQNALLLIWAPILGSVIYLATIFVFRRWLNYLEGGLFPGNAAGG